MQVLTTYIDFTINYAFGAWCCILILSALIGLKVKKINGRIAQEIDDGIKKPICAHGEMQQRIVIIGVGLLTIWVLSGYVGIVIVYVMNVI